MMSILVPLTALLAIAPAPLRYDVSATVALDGRRIAAPRMTVAAGIPAVIETGAYRLTITVTPMAKGTMQIDSSIALPSNGEWKPVGRLVMPTKTGSVHYSRETDSGSVAVTIDARRAPAS